MSIPGSASPLFFQTAAADAAAAGPIKSVRFNKADSAYLNKSFSTTGNQKTFTISLWIKKCLNTTSQYLFTSEHTGGDYFEFTSNADQIQVYNNASTAVNVKLERKLRDPSAWYHLVLAVDTTQATESDRLKIYINGEHQTDYVSSPAFPAQNYTFDLPSSRDRQIGVANFSGSLQGYFDGSMADFYFIDGAAKDVTDFGAFDDSGVWQAAAYSGTFGTNGFHLFDFANESGIGNDSSGNDNDFTVNNIASGDTALFTGGTYTTSDLWSGSGSASDSNFHDSNAGTGVGTDTDAAAFIKNNLGGSRYVTSVVVGYGSDSIATGSWGTGYISGAVVEGSNDDSSYTSIGTCTATTDDQEFSVNARYQYIRIRMADNYLGVGTFKINVTGNSNNDVLRDVPTNGSSDDDTGAGGEVSGNYCVFNALDTPWTLSNGNLDAVAPSSPNQSLCPGTIFVNSGKWYAEITLPNNTTSTRGMVGVHKLGADQDGILGKNSGDGAGYIPSHDTARVNGTETTSFFGQTYTSNNIIVGIALDLDDGTVDIYVDGTLAGELATGLSGYYTFAACDQHTTGAPNAVLNAGQRAFAYSAPSGFKALCTTNLPTPTIADGSDYFGALSWTGDGTGSRSFTGLSFQPDLTWVKIRTLAYAHTLFDAVRGAGSNKELSPDVSSAEGAASSVAYGYLSSFDSTGFSSTEGSVDNDYFNKASATYVAWSWDAGTSTVSNTDGTITSNVRANQTAGFSIISYTGNGTKGATIGHGLNAAPDFVICKRTDGAEDWWTGHVSPGWTTGAYLQVTDTFSSSANTNWWNSTAPSSSVITLGTYPNTSGATYICLAFASVAGYSAIGSYEGTGSSGDGGPFVPLDFQPAFILIKSADYAGNWYIYDNGRFPNNPKTGRIFVDTNGAEGAVTDDIDFLSNGFKIRTSGLSINGSGNTHIYYAVATNPFQANGGLAR